MENQNIINEEKGNDVNHVLAAAPFSIDAVEDVRILIKANGKHYSIVPNETACTREEAKEIRIGLLRLVLEFHAVVDKALEDINKDELKSKL